MVLKHSLPVVNFVSDLINIGSHTLGFACILKSRLKAFNPSMNWSIIHFTLAITWKSIKADTISLFNSIDGAFLYPV